MKSRLTKEEAFEKWGIALNKDFSLSKLKKAPREAVEGFIKYFPKPFNNKSGLCIISKSIDSFIIASCIADKLYDKVSKAIRIFQIPEYAINAARYSDMANDMLKEADEKVVSADLIILNEIAPTSYNESQKLLLYHLISSCVNKRKSYIITANNPVDEISKHLSSSLMRLITTYSCIIGV